MGILFSSFDQFQSSMGKVNSAGINQGSTSKAGSGASSGVVTAGLISGIADIATGFINAQRTKNAYKFNAALAEIDAKYAKASAKFTMARIREKADQLFGKQRALYSKAGVTLEGSPAKVMTQSLKEAEIDAILTEINAEYYGGQKELEAGYYNMEGKLAKYDAWENTGRTILNMAVKQAARG